MNGWKPIKDAPTLDGARVVIGGRTEWGGEHAEIARWDASGKRWLPQSGRQLRFKPTHFAEIDMLPRLADLPAGR